MHKLFYFVIKTCLVLLISFVLLLTMGFFAVRFGWTDVRGGEDFNSFEYNLQAEINRNISQPIKKISFSNSSSSQIFLDIATSSIEHGLPESEIVKGFDERDSWCKILVAEEFNSYSAISIFEAYHKTHSEILLNNMLLALKFRLPNREEFSKKLDLCRETEALVSSDDIVEKFLTSNSVNLYSWQNGEPWKIIREAVVRDREVIHRAATEVGIQPRLLLSVAIVEQLRLYYTQRELFEKVFKPLKILANANKMAWGVMAIKEKMAIETENHLKDSSSSFYLGSDFSTLLDFPEDVDKNKERYFRLTNKDSHYYSYLYGALILRQFQLEWEQAGYPIQYRPEIIATLFNIGFHNSEPKENPKVGGSTIVIDGDKYYFGSLAFEFYYSGELSKEFPFE